MGKNDRRLEIPAAYKIKVPCVNIVRVMDRMPVKISGQLYGRPSAVIKKIIDLGFEHKLFDRTLIQQLIAFGFDRGYWKDVDVMFEPFAYWAADKNLTKQKRKKEHDLNGEAEIQTDTTRKD